MTSARKRVAVTALAAAMLTGSLAGCVHYASIDQSNPTVSVMTKSYNPESAAPDSPVVKALEDYLGTKLDISWIPSSGYDEKVTAALASGQYPHAMLISSRSSSIIKNSRVGTFWDITDIFSQSDKYPNLSQTSEMINHNMSIDGKVYGIYRSRVVGRAGVSIRKDWLDNLHMDMPETIDDFYEVLKAFKEKDPDGNGENDTYGMIITNYLTGPLNNLAIWMGAPNAWGYNEETQRMEPAFMSPEFFEALNFLKRCYAEGLINQDMSSLSSDKWNEQFLSGTAGVIIDVADRARRLAQNISKINPDAEVDVFGYVKKDKNAEARTLPTTGYDGYYVFPKASVLTEDDLDFVLHIMDRANDEKAVNLMNYGIEGRNYNLDEDGYVVKVDDSALTKEYADLNQFSMGIVSYENGLSVAYTSEVAKKIDDVYEDNEKWAVANPCEPYVSNTYSRKGPQLDAIMSEANTKFIVGQMSEEEWKGQIERWKQRGGEEVMKEMTEAYEADTSVNN